MTPGRAAGDIALAPCTAEHGPAVLELVAQSLGWERDERHARLFAWKHAENPFGASPAWVALDGDRVVGYRAFLRWEFERAGGRVVRAVRAVDTATRPSHQGRGLFTRLTRHALEELRADGVGFVFNTPNEKSRPGYLKMGWSLVGRLATFVRPTSLTALPRIARARVPAERWAEPSRTGVPAEHALADRAGLAALLASQPPADRLRTRRTPEHLAWRYPSDLLGYRAFLAGRSVEEGVAVFRVRRRGAAREAALCELLVPGGDAGAAAALARRLARTVDADHVLRLGAAGRRPAGFAPLPGQGPVLAWRAVVEDAMPALDSWDLGLGDVELF